MSVFEHLMTLGSFILALGVASILTFASTLVHRRREANLSAAVLLWSLAIFMHQIAFWLGAYQFEATERASYVTVAFVVLQPVLYYLQSATVVVEQGAPLDLPAHHARHGRIYIALVTLSSLMDLAFFWHVALDNPDMRLTRLFVAMSASLAVCVAALLFQRRWVQIAMPALYVALQAQSLYFSAKPLMSAQGFG